MIRMNMLLLIVLVACALATVAGEHRTRQLFVKLQEEQEIAKQMQIEWRQLQLELSTWSTHARVEKIATQQLKMKLPGSEQIQILPLSAADKP